MIGLGDVGICDIFVFCWIDCIECVIIEFIVNVN